MLPEVDVQDLQTVLGCGIQKLRDRLPRHLIALCERSEAYGLACLGGFFDLRRIGDVVPGDTFADVIGGNPDFVERHLDGAGGVIDTRHDIMQPLPVKCLQRAVAQFVVAHCAHRDGIMPELAGMECKVGRCAA